MPYRCQRTGWNFGEQFVSRRIIPYLGVRALKGYSPIVPGHEIVGDVVAVGLGEQVWRVGDRAGGGWHGGHDRMAATNASEPIDYRSPEQL